MRENVKDGISSHLTVLQQLVDVIHQHSDNQDNTDDDQNTSDDMRRRMVKKRSRMTVYNQYLKQAQLKPFISGNKQSVFSLNGPKEDPMTIHRWLPLGLLALSAAASAGGGQIRTASMLANTCNGCHGTNGASVGESMPTIGGFDKGYLFAVLNAYKKDSRPSTIMGRLMKGYSDGDIRAISAFFANQPWVSADRVADASQAQQGRELHESKCKSCHEDGGREQDDESPRLAG